MNDDVLFGLAFAVAVALVGTAFVRFLAWVFERDDARPETADGAFELARSLFGDDPWVQVIVSRTGDGYIATAHNHNRTIAVSACRFGETAEEAVRLLCVNLRRQLDNRTKPAAATENVVH
jgi:hypothetical protein